MQHDDYLAVSILQTERQTHRGEMAYDMKSSSLMRRSTWAPGLCSRCSLLAVTRTLFQYILHTNHQPSQGTAAVTDRQTDRQTERETMVQSLAPCSSTYYTPTNNHHKPLPLSDKALKALKKVKFSHTRYRALGPELIPVYRQSARR